MNNKILSNNRGPRVFGGTIGNFFCKNKLACASSSATFSSGVTSALSFFATRCPRFEKFSILRRHFLWVLNAVLNKEQESCCILLA